MRYKNLIAVTLAGFFGYCLTGCSHGLITQGREAWIKETVPMLHAYQPAPNASALKQVKDSPNVVSIEGDQGLLKLTGDDWIYFRSFSSHESPPDLILAIDKKGRVYGSNGHVCPYLLLYWGDRKPTLPLSMKDFLAAEVSPTGCPGSARWVHLSQYDKTQSTKAKK